MLKYGLHVRNKKEEEEEKEEKKKEKKDFFHVFFRRLLTSFHVSLYSSISDAMKNLTFA